MKLLNKIINMEDDAPSRTLTFNPNTITPITFQSTPGVIRRAGKPRVTFVENTMGKIWTLICRHINNDLVNTPLDLNNQLHCDASRHAASIDLHHISPNFLGALTPKVWQAAETRGSAGGTKILYTHV